MGQKENIISIIIMNTINICIAQCYSFLIINYDLYLTKIKIQVFFKGSQKMWIL